ncbi:GNAT family N-acetyltransferase [Alkalihalobacillus trypoxylicola]|uniref:Acetyltransferase n=1 Tax=Alkalihalobacillus trypoxylicola TaxID=519424 RepID=A0A162EF13_9BACI|nr:GNAT family N-acetyltransferase [Alkalihalobacillus trypoxylicola]KYG32419.1 acetyltransferase [Alkalihalobacillus trypoxylicola]
MNFTTERLTVRPFLKQDIEDVYTIYKDELTCKYLLHEHWTSENKEMEFEKKLENSTLSKNNALSLAVVTSSSKTIGDLSIWYTSMKDTVEVGYCFSKDENGKGYATEAMNGLANQLFADFQLHRIQATLDARNTASKKVCERIGMRQEAYFVQDYWSKNEWTDSIVFGMLLSDLK